MVKAIIILGLLIAGLIGLVTQLSLHKEAIEEEIIEEIILGGTDTFTTPGFNQWTAPTGVTIAYVACWGSGAGGVDAQNAGGGGGGGGAFASSTVTVTPGTGYDIYIGIGGAESTSGATTTFATTTVVAVGGNTGSDMTKGLGGLAEDCTGDVKSSGGDGGDGETTDDTGGGGGGAGGYAGAGGNGTNGNGTIGGTGGTGANGTGGAGGAGGDDGGAGGNGVNGGASALGGGGGGGGDNGDGGGTGGAPGGGGGGADVATSPESEGANGQCIVTSAFSSPTVVLNTADEMAFGADTTPTLEFTGTDPESENIRYNIQIANETPINNVIETDKYSEDNYTHSKSISGDTYNAMGQSFTGDGNILKSAKFYLSKTGSPTGNATTSIYAHSGTFGVSSIPTGVALATSDNVDVSTFTGSFQLITFAFSGANQIPLINGTKYVVVIRYTGGSGLNFVSVAYDLITVSHGGNYSFYETGWIYDANADTCFYIYTTNVLLDKLSGTDDGFTNTEDGGDTDPFTSGQKCDYTVQAGDALSTDTYYWRVKGLDPTGSNTYGAWSSPTRSFTVDTGAPPAVEEPDDGVIWFD